MTDQHFKLECRKCGSTDYLEFFEINDDDGFYLCGTHYGEELDAMAQRNPPTPPVDEQGRNMWWNADTLTWCRVR